MSAIILLIFLGILVAGGFLAAFIWAVRSGQYDDDYSPSVRMLYNSSSDKTDLVEIKGEQDADHETEKDAKQKAGPTAGPQSEKDAKQNDGPEAGHESEKEAEPGNEKSAKQNAGYKAEHNVEHKAELEADTRLRK